MHGRCQIESCQNSKTLHTHTHTHTHTHFDLILCFSGEILIVVVIVGGIDVLNASLSRYYYQYTGYKTLVVYSTFSITYIEHWILCWYYHNCFNTVSIIVIRRERFMAMLVIRWIILLCKYNRLSSSVCAWRSITVSIKVLVIHVFIFLCFRFQPPPLMHFNYIYFLHFVFKLINIYEGQSLHVIHNSASGHSGLLGRII